MSDLENYKSLLRHQTMALQAMEILEQDRLITTEEGNRETQLGFLQGPIGSGKKVTILSLISRNKMRWDTSTPYIETEYSVHNSGMVIDRILRRYSRLNQTLVVTSSIKEWKEELSFTSIPYIEIKKETQLYVSDIKDGNFELVLVHSKIYNSLVAEFSNYAWKRFVYEDPCLTTIRSMRTVRAGFHWILCDSVDRIDSQYQSRDHKHYLKKIFRNTSKNAEIHFSNIIVRHIPESLELLTVIEHEFFNLNLLNCTEENVLSSIDVELHKTIKDQSDIEPCPICMKSVTSPIFDKICGKVYCSSCLVRWFKNSLTCPNCRSPITRHSIAKLARDPEEVCVKGEYGIITKIIDDLRKREESEKVSLLIIDSQRSYMRCGDMINNLRRYSKNADWFHFATDISTLSKKELSEITDIVIHGTDPLYRQIGKFNNISRKIPLTIHRLVESQSFWNNVFRDFVRSVDYNLISNLDIIPPCL